MKDIGLGKIILKNKISKPVKLCMESYMTCFKTMHYEKKKKKTMHYGHLILIKKVSELST